MAPFSKSAFPVRKEHVLTFIYPGHGEMSSPLLKNLEAPTSQDLHAETPDLICVISPIYWKLLVFFLFVFVGIFFFWPQVVNCRSVTKSCLTPCNAIDCSMPSFSVLHYLKFAQTHVH